MHYVWQKNVFVYVAAAATTVAPTSEAVCVVTPGEYESVHGNEPEELGVFGWKESDGVTKNFPTDDSEKVYVGDSVSVYDEVRINPCYTWYVRTKVLYRNSLWYT